MTEKSSHHGLARYVFLYLLILVTLIFVGVAFGQVAFQLINYFFPESTWSYDGGYSQEVLRFAISALVVAAPVYLFATRKVNQDLELGDLRANIAIRRWLIYLVLLAASLVAIGFFIGLFYSFLSGELTIKFALKTLSALLIAGSIIGYYTYDLKRESFERGWILRSFMLGFIALVVLALVAAFALIDSPYKARELREDAQRVSQLQQIQWQIQSYFETKKQLPASLDALITEAKIEPNDIQDPVTGESFIYSTQDKNSYQLCADFHRSDRPVDAKQPQSPYIDSDLVKWRHAAGQQCFQIKVGFFDTKEGYPISEVKPVK